MVDLFVTYLEMTSPPSGLALSPASTGTTIQREVLDPSQYLALYRAVGEPLQWDQRLRMPADDLRDFLSRSSTLVYVLRVEGQAVGFCEFDGVGGAEVELVHFGLVPAFQGRKLGPCLLDRALREIWSYAPQRIWLHTDTNDHPKAKSTYQRAGFRIYAGRMETFPD
jgi:ribosomal protein S18 acetylase RimI-like enzyme